MGLFDNLFGKKAQDATANEGQVDAPQNPDTTANTATPVVNNNVTISEDGQFAPPPTVQPQTTTESPEATDVSETVAPATEPETPTETSVPVESTEEVVGPNESNLETPAEPTESSEEKTA